MPPRRSPAADVWNILSPPMRRLWSLTVACLVLSFVMPSTWTSAVASSVPMDGPQLAFTAVDALKPRGFSIRLSVVTEPGAVVLAQGSSRGVVPNPFSSISWSADGVWLAFAGSKGKTEGIYKLRSDGTGLRFLRGTTGGSNPIFPPMGARSPLRGNNAATIS